MSKLVFLNGLLLLACLLTNAAEPSVALKVDGFTRYGDVAVACMEHHPSGTFTAQENYNPDPKHEIIINGPIYAWTISPTVSFFPSDQKTMDLHLNSKAFGKSYVVKVVVSWIIESPISHLRSLKTAKAQITLVASLMSVKIIEPDEFPVTDNNFTFSPTAPGVCNVTASGTSGVQSEDPSLEWTLKEISGSTKTSDPDPSKGAIVTFHYTGLPLENSQFGKKKLTLKHPQLSQNCGDEQMVEIFFDGNDDSVNHPGAGAGVTPNWFYYWLQTSAAFGSHKYDGGYNGYGVTRYNLEIYEWVSFIGPRANGSYSGKFNGKTSIYNGIDLFAIVCRHEARHVQTLNYWWPRPNEVDESDDDNDMLPDSQESELGGTTESPINGGPFDPSKADTDGDLIDDCEAYTCATQQPWVIGSADSQDWSNPGHQTNK